MSRKVDFYNSTFSCTRDFMTILCDCCCNIHNKIIHINREECICSVINYLPSNAIEGCLLLGSNQRASDLLGSTRYGMERDWRPPIFF
jgi:hypothetical protein